MNKDLLKRALSRLDEIFVENDHKGATFLACGGGALILMGLITRDTVDLDVIEPSVNGDVLKFVSQVAKELKLDDRWLNSDCETLSRDLPKGWKSDLAPLFGGRRVIVMGLSRQNIINTKFWALCDRSDDDLEDLINLQPTENELNSAVVWTMPLDGHPDWSKHVQDCLGRVKKRLGHV